MSLFNHHFDTAAKQRIAAYEANLQANASEENWLLEKDTEVEITVRGRGKCHPAIQHSRYGIILLCSCPGSQNGSLVHQVRKVADGHAHVNCGN